MKQIKGTNQRYVRSWEEQTKTNIKMLCYACLNRTAILRSLFTTVKYAELMHILTGCELTIHNSNWQLVNENGGCTLKEEELYM